MYRCSTTITLGVRYCEEVILHRYLVSNDSKKKVEMLKQFYESKYAMKGEINIPRIVKQFKINLVKIPFDIDFSLENNE